MRVGDPARTAVAKKKELILKFILEKRKGEQSKFKTQISLYPSLEELKQNFPAKFDSEICDAINKVTDNFFFPLAL